MRRKVRFPDRVTLGLLGILALAAILRVWGIRFGLPEPYHPDETVRLALTTLRDKGNPHFFNYPSLLLYLQGILFMFIYLFERVAGNADSAQGWLAGLAVDPSPVFIVARLQSAAFGVLTVGFAYRLTIALTGSRLTSLIAALSLAVALPHVQDSHFATVDIPLAFFVTAALLVMVGMPQSTTTNWKRHLVAGVFTGLAAGTKYPGGLLVLVMLTVHLLYRPRPYWRLWSADRLFAIFAMSAAVTFLCSTPFAVLSVKSFIAALRFEAEHAAAGQVGFYVKSGILFHLKNSFMPPVSWLFVPIAAVGLVSGLIQKRTRPDLLIICAFLVIYGGTVFSSHLAFERYVLPMLPVACVLFASGISILMSRLPSKRLGATVCMIVIAGVVVPSAWASVAHNRLLSLPDTRQLAANWLRTRISDGLCLYNLAPAGSELSWHEPDPARLRVICMGEQRSNGEAPFQDWSRPRYVSFDAQIPSIQVLRDEHVAFVIASSFRITKYLSRGSRFLDGKDSEIAVGIGRLYEDLQPYRVMSFSPYAQAIPLRDDLPGKSVYSPAFPHLLERVASGPTLEVYQLHN